ncbi:MAG: (2Fe-2S)-binding protein [Flavobacteriaceae bacterium]|nr:(2Fe-2S)-binding protein [Flavobacteriaceae bacterium]|tara:strand:+ start:519 stop:986 length:468 start_codon:yes stop_codon:yes gene_type:complete
MPVFNLNINSKKVSVNASSETPLLWVLRDEIGLVGTKFGCGIGSCGACTIHLNGSAKQSCNLAISSLEETDQIKTIEGISEDGSHPVQEAWKENDVAQCGYCQSGQIMKAISFLNKNPNPSSKQLRDEMKDNICRCATYNRIEKAVLDASKKISK